jgi:hypothetical protein
MTVTFRPRQNNMARSSVAAPHVPGTSKGLAAVGEIRMTARSVTSSSCARRSRRLRVRAALALTDAATRLHEGVADAIWEEAVKHWGEAGVGKLVSCSRRGDAVGASGDGPRGPRWDSGMVQVGGATDEMCSARARNHRCRDRRGARPSTFGLTLPSKNVCTAAKVTLMKKNVKKLILSRETVRTLDATELTVSGAKPKATNSNCELDGCGQTVQVGCGLNTHYLVCQ